MVMSRRVGAVLAAAAMVGSVGSAVGVVAPASATEAGGHDPGVLAVQEGTPEHQRVTATTPTFEGPAGSLATAAEINPLRAVSCPNGGVRTVLGAESFADGVMPELTEGWSSGLGDASGSYFFAFSGQSPATDPPQDNVMVFDAVQGKPGVTTYLSFASAGTDVFDHVHFGVNDEVFGADLTPDWTRITVDVTAAAAQNGGALETFFVHVAGAAEHASWSVDDVSLFTCGPTPASGVRGDWTGEGSVDVLGTTAAGELFLYPGKSSGGVYAGRQIGTGWDAMTWLGSPGDINGDRRTDLLARSADGFLYLYPGRGDGQLGKAVLVGQKWNAMTAFITAGDVDGDGRVDLLARRSDGTLHQYRFSSGGTLSWVRQAGKGWTGMAQMIGMGDLDGDRYGDVLGVTASGGMYAYRGTPTGLLGTSLLGKGWATMTALTSPGDMNRDGRGDLLARNRDGFVYFYPGTAAGIDTGAQVGSGWSGLTRII